MKLDDNINEGAMPRTSPHNGERAPLEEDVNMDDMNDLTEALPAEDTSTKPSDEARSDSERDLRLELITNSFDGQFVQLKDFTMPPECSQYPGLAQEVFDAYLDSTIFTVQVRINFDAAHHVFFEGTRATACGKLWLPKDKHDWLSSRNPKLFNFQRVRIDICTPFRPLAEFELEVLQPSEGVGLSVQGRSMQDPSLRAPTLIRYLNRCLKVIRIRGQKYQKLTMQNLEDFALLFHRDRRDNDSEDLWEEPAYGGGEWTGIEEPPRFGGRFTRFQFRT